ncbi:hypothetical protein [Streptomyces sp. ITFR-16]|uniref:hypothetical protein n=1 Tax=Streptomyces sp. ITFR-16 TaxID=3075198 RepID=UPI00288ABB34|nr:hypothetical protein [Streptomyces sp. ITFR-16]WNI26541.1 hypothetical protein RLT58_33715 [Streptomyces sp. ITFR-16]
MLISTLLGPRIAARRRFALAAALAAVVYAGAAPAAAAREEDGRTWPTSAQTHDGAADASAGNAVRDSAAVTAAAQRPVSARTLVFAGVGSAVGLAVFVGGGWLTSALRTGRTGATRRPGRDFSAAEVVEEMMRGRGR